ncbi:Alkaline phosphatase synthesis transcriptional regulatory protein SphR [Paenibacillus polymyxa E681]|uniref:response regulator transcription factor n=1 Tax=Paenibacillus polymyxa TaxID=1406 RepID=UPI0001E31C4B|nr:response regulator transcription factor [Paenibacillus polymyxa]ADM71419.1 LuxR family transcriptional regulator [Paenibacillus polymyxa E681]QNV58438.1 Alkaline phosphatase synthesis transcriptional regulatory protein SphR [Paenibacillus polymyxa E681]QNV63273.1 Alkaline phosphatase synthesis transcriptional regulatory protein SphR [Paenibacillus polymyxa E681]
MSKPRVLVVDDERTVRKLIKTVLEADGMVVLQAENGTEAMRMISEGPFDLVLLDIMMEDIDGYDVLGQSRNMGIHTPIIFLSGKKEDTDQIIGFGLGADAYITKPFSPPVLCAQVKNQIKRYRQLQESKQQASRIALGPFLFNHHTFTFQKNNQEIALSSKEIQLMKFFMEHPNQVFSKEQLYQNIWKDTVVDNNTIMVYIRHLRTKIEENPTNPKYIKTVWGIGYRFSVER